jgi:hypothetical protein
MTSRPARVPGRVIAWTALTVGLGASVAANVAAARSDLGPRAFAPTAPVVALLAAALLERIDLRGTRWWQRLPIVGGLVVVVALAFVTSYQHQQGLLLTYGNPALSAALLPIAVDALVLMSSVALTVIGGQRRAARGVWEAQRATAVLAAAVPAPAPLPVPAPPSAAVERVDPLGLDDRDVPAPEIEPADEPDTDPLPVPADTAPARRPPVPDRRILAALAQPDLVPRRSDGTVAVRELERRWGCRQDRAVRLLQAASLHRAGDGERVPGDAQPGVPDDTRELEDARA